LRRLHVNLANDESSPVGWLRFNGDAGKAVAECLSSLPQSEFQGELRSILDTSYGGGKSPVEAFGHMMTHLFWSSGLILADPLDPGMRTIAEPILRQVIAKNSEIRETVMARTRAISEAGYHEQVKVDSNFTGLFAFRGKSRQPVKPDEIAAMTAPL